MATTASAYGLRPSKKIGGEPWNHGMTTYKIASDYGTNIFKGDLVKMVTTGYIEKATNTSDAPANGFLGVFMGCSYVDTDMGLVFKDWYNASDVAVVANAFVVDDPDVLFEIQASAAVTIAGLGAKAHLVQGSGSTSTGVSGVTLDAANINTTNTFPLAIVDAVDRPGVSTIGDTYTDLLVRINIHAHRTTTGI